MFVDSETGRWEVSTDFPQVGQDIHGLMTRLFPICRSITGDGVRESLAILGEHIPLEIHEIPTGTEIFDWVVPKEWNIQGAYLKDASGRTILDFEDSNLHVLGYSTPFRGRLPLSELKTHLYTLPEHPDWIPYRTSYYEEKWGLCLSHNRLLGLADGDYEVSIDSSLEDGSLTYGEYLIQGDTPDEVLISTHVCHPSMANDNLSGLALATHLARHLRETSPRYSYRFLFTPGTIGSIAWLSLNRRSVSRIKHGLILACLGDSGGLTYKKSRRGDAEIDRAVAQVLRDSGAAHDIIEFFPFGYDERQFCSPGFNLPVGCLMRTPHGEFPEYHTSADDLEFVRPEHLADSFHTLCRVVQVLEGNRTYVSQNPNCEPQLGRRGLYRGTGGSSDRKMREMALLWVLNLSDGEHSLLDIAERSSLAFPVLDAAVDALSGKGLLRERSESAGPEAG